MMNHDEKENYHINAAGGAYFPELIFPICAVLARLEDLSESRSTIDTEAVKVEQTTRCVPLDFVQLREQPLLLKQKMDFNWISPEKENKNRKLQNVHQIRQHVIPLNS